MAPVANAGSASKGKLRPSQLLSIPRTEEALRYPPFQVRNTFIDTEAPRSPSFEERQVLSCPAEGIGKLRYLFQEDVVPDVAPEEPEVVATATREAPRRSATSHELGRKMDRGASGGSSVATSASDGSTSPGEPAERSPGQASHSEPQAAVLRVRLADAVLSGAAAPGPEQVQPDGMPSISLLNAIGSPVVPYVQLPDFGMPPRMAQAPRRRAPTEGLVVPPPPAPSAPPTLPASMSMAPAPDAATGPPTIGSMAHGTGRCKPCAFVYSTGCASGSSCQFCHLCEAGEKKRRRKQKLEARRLVGDARGVRGLARA